MSVLSDNILNRSFVSKELKVDSWTVIQNYFTDLEKRKIESISDLKKWLKDRSELESVLEEDLAWRYIKMNCNTSDEKLSESFNFFITDIEPEVARYSNILDKKLVGTFYLNELREKEYFILTRSLKKRIEIFREENIPIIAELQKEQQEYGKISSEMTIHYHNEEITLQKAANYLKNTDRKVRKEVFELINERRLKEVDKFNELFTRLIGKRNQLALNADFENYRDYKFADMGRFDYTVEDCHTFHDSIAKEVKPIIEDLHRSRQKSLKLDSLKPWDLEVDVDLKHALHPFKDTDELIDKSIETFKNIRQHYGEFLTTMKKEGYLDLDSRKGKAPGGFNYPLYESNIPFIYMNATGNMQDLETMMHEGGHAIHSFVSKDLELVNFKELPSEVAELASMSMELISMEYWDIFFKDKEELRRAKKIQLESILKVLPWIATVDKFQHWVYLNPKHTIKEREEAWNSIANEFGSSVVDWTGYETVYTNTWQKQLHIFEVPFYYIEYAMAQLGAISIWRNYKKNPQKALDDYENALKLGYSKTIPEIYEAAGIKFDFSQDYVRQLMQFVRDELKKIDE